MNFPFYIAKRYLISRKSHNIINIISGISIVGISIGTMALVIVLSVFNGLEEVVISLFNTFNPDLVIQPAKGKSFSTIDFPENKIRDIQGVVYYTEVIEENALLQYSNKQHIITIKGVSEEYQEMSRLDTCIVEGNFVLENGDRNYALMGIGVAYFLGIQISPQTEALTLYAPRRTSGYSLNFEQSFNSEKIIPSGIFSVQQDYDSKYIIVPIDYAKEILEFENELSFIELGISNPEKVDKIKEKISTLLGEDFVVKNRFEQQELLYKIMKSEKWAIFLILSFILLIATFNVIGSLSMLILDKKKDIKVLQSLGANKKLIKRIFFFEGILISIIGALSGLIAGAFICWLQQYFGLITLGQGNGSFVVDAYPVSMQLTDFIYIFTTVFIIGIIAASLPVQQISKKHFDQKLN